MANLKDLRNRIASVKSTQKITSAMKMVAASKLRRAQAAAEEARPYTERMETMLGQVSASVASSEGAPALLAGNGKDDVHMLVAVSADRGLCGGFNGSIVRATRRKVLELQGQGKQVKIFCVGRKARDQLNRDFPSLIIETIEDATKAGAKFDIASDVAHQLVSMFEAGDFDVCTIIYNRFKSAIEQIVTPQQVIPFPVPELEEAAADVKPEQQAQYLMEPSDDEILAELLPKNLSVQMFRAMLESCASEHGARMTAMDNATRNAGDMIDGLTLTYNRTRQAVITSELIEIISGAEAL